MKKWLIRIALGMGSIGVLAAAVIAWWFFTSVEYEHLKAYWKHTDRMTVVFDKKITAKDRCPSNDEAMACLVKKMGDLENNFGPDDFDIRITAIESVCKRNCLTHIPFYKAYAELTSQIHPELYWVSIESKKSKERADDIRRLYVKEMKKIKSHLMVSRKTFEATYPMAAPELKAEIAQTVKVIDQKLEQIQRLM